MADLVLRKVVAPAAKWTLKKLWQELGYMFCYKSNIGDLNERVQQLHHKIDGIKQEERSAREALKVIDGQVSDWLVKADKQIEEKETTLNVKTVEAKAACCYGWLPNLKGRFSLGRNAKNMTVEVDQLLATEPKTISHPAPHPEVEFQPTEHSTHLGTHFHEGASPSGTSNHEQTAALLNFDSRRSTFEDVMEALRGNQINPIIICGMGGIGKTTLMGQVHDKAKEEGLFDEYAKATFKESFDNDADFIQIQGELAEYLGKKLLEDVRERDPRACKLRERLSQGSKNILVMLDNVWTTTPNFLWDIGIPRTCKLLVTSRQQDLFKDMDSRKNFPIYGLPDKDAWSLFKKTAGSSIESDPELQVVAEKILKECAGLPIAISTVGTALKGESIGIWKNALKELEKANPENVPGVIQHVYGKIKFSYECLTEQAKSCFLLCCIFEESGDIRIEDLVRYGFGLELFKGIDSMVEGRNRVEALVRTLKSRFLLLDCDEKECVRMHDVVRDVAVHIASEEFAEKKDDRVEKRIVVRDTVETLNLMDWPISEQPAFCRSLSIGGRCVLLWLELASVLKRQLRMEDLKVLEIMGTSLSSVVPSLAVMKNLQTLRLEEYGWDDREVFDASVIGEMRTLKILSLRGCWGLEQLPDTFKNLSDLTLLDLSRCNNLKVISAGVISSLTRLEELYMLPPSYDWISDKLASTETTNSISQLQAELVSARSKIVMPFEDPAEVGKQSPSIYIRWANCMDWESGILAELLSLTRLTTLHVVLPPLNHILLSANLFKKLERFFICLYWRRRDVFDLRYAYAGIDGNYLEVYDIDSSAAVGSGITSLLKITSSLAFSTVTETQLVNVVDTICFAKIKNFKLNMYNDVEYLIDTTRVKPTTPHGSSAIFPLLSLLEIQGCDSGASRLKQIFHGELPTGSLNELQTLILSSLPNLIYIWKINGPSEWGVLTNILRRVQVLQISVCMSFEGIVAFEYDNEEVINFQSLAQLTLSRLPNFTGMTKNISKGTGRPPENNGREKSNVIIQSLFDTKVQAFQNLKELSVSGCDRLRTLLSPSIARGLVKLQRLQIDHCAKIEEIVAAAAPGEETEEENMFPQLDTLRLERLPNLGSFSQGKHNYEWPLVKYINIHTCPNMKKFCLGSLSLPKAVEIDVQGAGESLLQELNNSRKEI